ncbi:endonuclease/exonuclease/phosphatase family protein [Chloroflexota bacterium]
MPETKKSWNLIDKFLRRWLPPLLWAYFTLLFGWLGAYLLFGDRQGYLAIVNQLAELMFLPLPLVLLAAVYLRRREVWVGTLAALVVFGVFWGPMFTPRLGPAPAGERLTVMTYNTLGPQPHTEPMLAVLQAEQPDVVLIQELSPEQAAVLQTELIDLYPYQVLDPQPSVIGMGAISKYPLADMPDQLQVNWVGEPQVLNLSWQGQEVVLVNFHMWAFGIAPAEYVEENFRTREGQARALAKFAAGVDGPLIVAGDANVSSLSDAYEIFTADLEDAWRQAGWGFGHTFPGSDIPGSSRPRVSGRPVPQWLVRIDYVLYNQHWAATEAHLAPFDGVSDHRGVVVELVYQGRP